MLGNLNIMKVSGALEREETVFFSTEKGEFGGIFWKMKIMLAICRKDWYNVHMSIC